MVKQKSESDKALAGQKHGRGDPQPEKQKPSDENSIGSGTQPEAGSLSGMLWILVIGVMCWWLGLGRSDGQGDSEPGLLQMLLGVFTGGWVNVVIGVLWKVLLVLAGITAVYFSRKISVVPAVTPISDQGTSVPAPEPRDVLERQLQTMGFHYLGDYNVTSISSLPSRIRAYCDADRHTAAVLLDMTMDKQTTTVLQFGTRLHPYGNIVTSNGSLPSIYAHPPGSMQARVPWKKTAAEVFSLHQLLCRTAREEHFEAETVHSAAFAEIISKGERRECEYQVQIGRLKQIAVDKYRQTLLGIMIAVPLIWWQMIYGPMFSWFKIPDGFFCWKLRRTLGRLTVPICIQSDWARCEQSPGELDIEWLEELVGDLESRRAVPWIRLGYGNPVWPEGGTAREDSPLPGFQALSGWDAYVQMVVEKLKTRVKAWEIWNEPNHPKHRIDPEAYATFVMHTAKILRLADPQACIRFGAIAGIDVEYVTAVLSFLGEKGGLELVDELTVHPYTVNADVRLQGKEGIRELRALLHKVEPRLRLVQED